MRLSAMRWPWRDAWHHGHVPIVWQGSRDRVGGERGCGLGEDALAPALAVPQWCVVVVVNPRSNQVGRG